MEEAMDQKGAGPQGAEEDKNDPFADLIMHNWLGIAAVAWEGFSTRGRGMVVLTEGDGKATLAYQPGPPCPCHAEMVAGYDPERQVVIAHCATRDDICCLNVFGGWPAPPDAATSASAMECAATVN